MRDTSTLKPCPFCGAMPEIIADKVTTWGLIEHHDGCFFPSWPKHEIKPIDWDAWNRRAAMPNERNR